ncbi:MAG: DoxX family protein [Bacteroidetes bacterium]|nr:DoxX family protein [Bacteroidota bacterium]
METQPMSKARKITGWILVGLLSAFIIMTGVIKLISHEDSEPAQNFIKWGLEGKLMLIGIAELISIILFLIPKTSSLGVLLLSGYFGGAIATHLEHGISFIFPAIILLLIWIANYLRNPEMLASFRKK